MTTTEFSTGHAVPAHEIRCSDARRALAAIGFIPLVTVGGAEHWVRHERRVILHVDSDDAANDVCDETMLAKALFVDFFALDGETLLASV